MSFLVKLQVAGLQLKKDTPAQVLYCEFCKMPENTYFTGHFWMTASVHYQFRFVD